MANSNAMGADKGVGHEKKAEFHLVPFLRMPLRKRIAGQDEAVQALVELYQTFCVGLNSPARPVGNLLFSRADRLRQDRAFVEGRPAEDSVRRIAGRLIKVDCGEFQHSHEIRQSLIGSPPGVSGGTAKRNPLITPGGTGQEPHRPAEAQFPAV